ncbi:hypothetical protein PT974_10389 [Cladobotryum mycophilum]|uniref:Uncharacterized protein n=1 Tax=Cladobotryum mycophilum TaxID=491253 RepID=A0ABR0SAL3_9HYPO
MVDTSNPKSFVFITSTNRLRPDNNHARQQIRRQAMSRAAYSRRQRGGYGKVNLFQAPAQSMSSDQPHDPLKQRAFDCVDDETIDSHLSATILISPSSVDYEKIRIRYNLDLLDLSALTSFHVTYATASSLASNPDILRDIVGRQQLSYLTHVPGRYGQSHALASAVECVSARAHQWLIAPHQPVSSEIIVLYLRALKAVQAALENPHTNMQPEVLCATELLGIYELFSTSTEQRWASHSSGSTALIKLRGPDRYTSDFEKGLLASHIGQIFHQSLNTNESCFLHDGPWQLVLRSIATNDGPFSDRSERVISLWQSACHLPYHLQKMNFTPAYMSFDSHFGTGTDDIKSTAKILIFVVS